MRTFCVTAFVIAAALLADATEHDESIQTDGPVVIELSPEETQDLLEAPRFRYKWKESLCIHDIFLRRQEPWSVCAANNPVRKCSFDELWRLNAFL